MSVAVGYRKDLGLRADPALDFGKALSSRWGVPLITLQELVRALGGEACGKRVLCPGPGHSRGDRSLQVMLFGDAPDGFLVCSFANDDWRDCRDHVRARLGMPAFTPRRETEAPRGQGTSPPKPDRSDDANRQRAGDIWRGGRRPARHQLAAVDLHFSPRKTQGLTDDDLIGKYFARAFRSRTSSP